MNVWKRITRYSIKRGYTNENRAYVMLYDKENIPKGHELRKMARWVNNRFVFASCKTFEEYKRYQH